MKLVGKISRKDLCLAWYKSVDADCAGNNTEGITVISGDLSEQFIIIENSIYAGLTPIAYSV